MKHLDLFSGIGGFSLAADWVWGKENVEHIFCEIEEFPQKVLMKHWPGSELYNDITKLDGSKITDVSLLTGGFPCQPYSVAGKQRGAEDDRALWPQMFRVIQETRPTWVIGENVPGFKNLALDSCCDDLESEGYTTQALNIPACAVNAEHIRQRLWILAYIDSEGLQERQGFSRVERKGNYEDKRENTSFHVERSDRPRICGRVHGIPARVHRIKALGNAIVPQVAAVIMQAIKEIDNP